MSSTQSSCVSLKSLKRPTNNRTSSNSLAKWVSPDQSLKIHMCSHGDISILTRWARFLNLSITLKQSWEVLYIALNQPKTLHESLFSEIFSTTSSASGLEVIHKIFDLIMTVLDTRLFGKCLPRWRFSVNCKVFGLKHASAQSHVLETGKDGNIMQALTLNSPTMLMSGGTRTLFTATSSNSEAAAYWPNNFQSKVVDLCCFPCTPSRRRLRWKHLCFCQKVHTNYLADEGRWRATHLDHLCTCS